MGVIKDKKSILLDTNSFIYYFENNPNYADKLEKLFTNIQNGMSTRVGNCGRCIGNNE